MDNDITKLAGYLASKEKAYDLIESLRWSNGSVCPHCGSKIIHRRRRSAQLARGATILALSSCQRHASVGHMNGCTESTILELR
jgi:DNA-directed RNA polymerase subunit RPC12/RpoP